MFGFFLFLTLVVCAEGFFLLLGPFIWLFVACTKRSANASVNEPRQRKRDECSGPIVVCDASKWNRRSQSVGSVCVCARCVWVYECVCARVYVFVNCICCLPSVLLLFLFRFYYMAISSFVDDLIDFWSGWVGRTVFVLGHCLNS